MTTWWAGLSLIMKIFWGITIASSLVFLIQTIMTFVGADGDLDGGHFGDIDSLDIDSAHGFGEGTNLYTFRNLINFLLGFGWTAVLLHESVSSLPLLLILAIGVGLALVALVMWMFKWLNSMQQSGTINVYKSAAGCEGTVYLAIPGHRSGKGKVQISINNSIREYEAETEGDDIPTGRAIRVVEAINPSTLLVDTIDSLII